MIREQGYVSVQGDGVGMGITDTQKGRFLFSGLDAGPDLT